MKRYDSIQSRIGELDDCAYGSFWNRDWAGEYDDCAYGSTEVSHTHSFMRYHCSY